ncbi:hypothetical protein ACFWWB_02045 [Streptomyces sp. NPDC058690]|uniref:hypothetical protein n=1 Tax=Streptomyces sp. NPDC058690 TaxID=3346600 RepID=UPI00364815D7
MTGSARTPHEQRDGEWPGARRSDTSGVRTRSSQLVAVEKAAAAICRHHGWTSRSVIGHKEWQPGKVDPLGFTMESVRARMHDRPK